MRCTEGLFADGIFIQGIRPPTVPPGTARLRVGLSSAHSEQHIEIAAKSMNSVLGAEGLR
jgi:7-keto-8-aminopelargonate synthetase-like enzyme